MGPESIKPYEVSDSGQTIDQVESYVNDMLHQTYGCNYSLGGPPQVVAGTLFDFEEMLQQLTSLPHIEFVSHRQMLAEPCPPDRVRIGIRHDIDADIVAAVKLAEIERNHNVPATWCVLHTAPYYGCFTPGRFHRNNCMRWVYLRLQELGHDVALHTDPLLIYQTHGMDGAQAVVTEIEWMREQGIEIHGTVAHNSKPVYGAWNYEIFKGRYEKGIPDASALDHVVFEGKWTPLRVLDERELGLEYEGNEALWRNDTPMEYGALRVVNQWRWIAHSHRLRDDPRLPETQFIDQARMIDEIMRLPPGRFVVLVVHPCYYGGRIGPRHSPQMRADRVTTSHNDQLGWFGYDSSKVQCCSGDRSREQGFQTINQPNAMGMLDFPWEPKAPEEDELSILILGADNIDGSTVPIPIQLQSRLAELIKHHTERKTRVHKLAFAGMGLSRLWSWYERTRASLKPQVVLIGIGGEAIRQNMPLIWSRETGVSHVYPAGDYLAWDSDVRNVTPVSFSTEWKAHRRDPRGLDVIPGTNIELAGAMADPEAVDVGGVNCLDYLTACYRYVCDLIRQDGGRPLLILEEFGESVGHYDEGGKESERAAYQTAVLEQITGIANDVGAPLVNPYELFHQNVVRLPAHHRRARQWNATGHRLAAESIYRVLAAEGLIQ